MHAIHFTVVVHACNGAALAVVVALRSLMRRIVKVLGAQNSAFSHTFPSIAVRAPNARHTRIQSLPSFFVMLCSVRAVVASSLLGGKIESVLPAPWVGGAAARRRCPMEHHQLFLLFFSSVMLNAFFF